MRCRTNNIRRKRVKLDRTTKEDFKRWLLGNLSYPVVWQKEPSLWGQTYVTTYKNITFKVCEGTIEVFIKDMGLVHTFYPLPFTPLWFHAWKMKRYVNQRERDMFNEEVQRNL
jgi:hypothetical protein